MRKSWALDSMRPLGHMKHRSKPNGQFPVIKPVNGKFSINNIRDGFRENLASFKSKIANNTSKQRNRRAARGV